MLVPLGQLLLHAVLFGCFTVVIAPALGGALAAVAAELLFALGLGLAGLALGAGLVGWLLRARR